MRARSGFPYSNAFPGRVCPDRPTHRPRVTNLTLLKSGSAYLVRVTTHPGETPVRVTTHPRETPPDQRRSITPAPIAVPGLSGRRCTTIATMRPPGYARRLAFRGMTRPDGADARTADIDTPGPCLAAMFGVPTRNHCQLFC